MVYQKIIMDGNNRWLGLKIFLDVSEVLGWDPYVSGVQGIYMCMELLWAGVSALVVVQKLWEKLQQDVRPILMLSASCSTSPTEIETIEHL